MDLCLYEPDLGDDCRPAQPQMDDVGSLFVWSGVTLAMGYAKTFDQLYFLRAVMGVSEAFYMPAGLALIADYHQGKTRSLAIGVHLSGVYLGQAFGGFGATIASNFSWHGTFHFFGLVGIVYSLVLLVLVKEKKTYIVDKLQKLSLGEEFSMAMRSLGTLFGNITFWIILFYFAAPKLSRMGCKELVANALFRYHAHGYGNGRTIGDYHHRFVIPFGCDCRWLYIR